MNQSSIQSGVSVGLVGLGVMGRGVALNIIKSGFKLLGRDVNPESLTWLTSIGGHIVWLDVGRSRSSHGHGRQDDSAVIRNYTDKS